MSPSDHSLLPRLVYQVWGRPSSVGEDAESDPGILPSHSRGRQSACGLEREKGEGGWHPSLRAAGSRTAVTAVAVRGVAARVGVADQCRRGRSVIACLVEAGRMAAWLAGELWLGREKR